jgi:methyl-accepting chemotaxis protein
MKSQWTIGKKLILAFLAVAAITLVLGVVGYYGSVKSEQHVHEIGVVRMPSVSSMLTIEGAANDLRAVQQGLLNMETTREQREEMLARIPEIRQRYEAAWEVYEPLPQTEHESELWGEFVPAWNSWKEASDRFFAAVEELSQTDILNPTKMRRDLEQFRGDHYRLHHV